MHGVLPIFLAAKGPGLDLVVWLIAGAIWLLSQMAAAKKSKDRKMRQAPLGPPPVGSRPGAGDAPTPNELVEIFKRLGADIPGTPPPTPRPSPRPAQRSASSMAYRPTTPRMAIRKPVARMSPEKARRMAQALVRPEDTLAADQAEATRLAVNAIVHNVQSREGEIRALDTATQHTGTILPRLYAMGLRLSPLPSVPMPGLLDRTHHTGVPLRARLHTRLELRNAIVAQNYLRPPKGFSP